MYHPVQPGRLIEGPENRGYTTAFIPLLAALDRKLHEMVLKT